MEYSGPFNIDKLFIKKALAYLFNCERDFSLAISTDNLVNINIVGVCKYIHSCDPSIFLVFFSYYFDNLFLLEPLIPVNDINILPCDLIMNVPCDLLPLSMLQL